MMETARDRRIAEIMLIVLVVGVAGLYLTMGMHRILILNLFFLPVVLSAYYFGRFSAGVLALLSALLVAIATTLVNEGFAPIQSPIVVFLALTLWSAILGLTAMLVGTLCDERARTLEELHKSYVGVVDVVSQYLQSADSRCVLRSTSIAEMSQEVARSLGLSQKQIDDVRVAAMLHNLENVEVSTQLITKAIDALDIDAQAAKRKTFQGTDLAQSLGQVLEGAMPLLVRLDDGVQDYLDGHNAFESEETPIGTRIIDAVRQYVRLAHNDDRAAILSPEEALRALREDTDPSYANVLDALERVVQRSRSPRRDAVLSHV